MQIGHLLQGVQASVPRSFDLMPTGTYTAIVSGAEVKNTKAGDAAINFEYTIIDGEFNNRKVWDYMTVGHSNPKWAALARGNLKALASACNLAEPQNTTDLYDIPFGLMLDQKKSTKTDAKVGDMEQAVMGYVELNIAAKVGRLPPAAPAAPLRPSAPAVAAAPARAAVGAAAPWAKKA
jgi:hypothetical protein